MVLVLWNPVSEETERKVPFTATIVDAHPFRDDSIIAVLVSGEIVMANGTNFENQYTITTMLGAMFLTGEEGSSVYISNALSGSVEQIIANGSIFDDQVVVSIGHAAPEGIDVCGDNCILLVAAGTGTLEKVDLSTGNVTVVACDLDFQSPLGTLLPFGFHNDVQCDDGFAFVNGDGSNVVYKVDLNGLQETDRTSGGVRLVSQLCTERIRVGASLLASVMFG